MWVVSELAAHFRGDNCKGQNGQKMTSTPPLWAKQVESMIGLFVLAETCIDEYLQ